MNLDLDFLISFMSAKTCSESTEKGNKKYNEGYKPVRVVQFLLLAFECNNLFQKPTDSWPMGTVSLPKENRLDSLSVERVSETDRHTPHKPGLRPQSPRCPDTTKLNSGRLRVYLYTDRCYQG